MKILIITNHSYMLYRFRKDLIEALMREHEVVLSMPFVGHEDDFRAMGLRCIHTEMDRRGINPITDMKLFHTYRKLLKEEHPDLVITYSIKPNIYAGFACGLEGIPFCVNVQGLGTAFQKNGLAQVASVMYKTALQKAKTVFFENEGNAREFINRKIITAEKAVVLSGAGINLTEYPCLPYPENDRMHFLFMGRIMNEKGVNELFAAMRKLRQVKGDQVVLDLVGFLDDDYEEELNRLGTEGIVKFHGFQTDPRPFYASADCVVLPSYHEGMSNVLLEAGASGRPVVTSDIHGCKETVENGETGLLCQPRDVESLYEQMLRMTQFTAQERGDMGKAARAKMEREFDKKLVVAKTIHALGITPEI